MYDNEKSKFLAASVNNDILNHQATRNILRSKSVSKNDSRH